MNSICSRLAENGSWLALVIGSVIALALVFDKKCENRSNKKIVEYDAKQTYSMRYSTLNFIN